MALRARLAAPPPQANTVWPWHSVKSGSISASALFSGDRRMEAETFLSSGYGLRIAIQSKRDGWVSFDKLAKVEQPGRLKGILVAPQYGRPFLTATQVFDVRPIPRKFLAVERMEGAKACFVLGMHLTPPSARSKGWKWQMSKIIREPLPRWKADFLRKELFLALYSRCDGRTVSVVPIAPTVELEIIAGALALFWMLQASFRSGLNGFPDTHLPMRTWFRAMWYITSQKNGVSALGLQRVLGLGGYRTAWLMLHKLRQAMVRPGREKLSGVLEVDETYWGSAEIGCDFAEKP